jgi:hypothetical protein
MNLKLLSHFFRMNNCKTPVIHKIQIFQIVELYLELINTYKHVFGITDTCQNIEEEIEFRI